MRRLGYLVVMAALALLLAACGAGDDDSGSQSDARISGDASPLDDAGVGGDPDGGDVTPSRWLVLEGVVNARDVGGYQVASGQHVRWRMLLRGGHLGNLSTAGCAAFEALGVSTVVDLRETTEQSQAPSAACVTAASTVVPVSMPQHLPASAANYLRLMSESDAAVAQLFTLLASASAEPVYVHCVIGRDRASFAVALILLALGADRQVVLEDFRLTTDAGYAVQDAWIEAVLDEIDNRGGIETYLSGLGVTPAQLQALRAWALE